MMVGSQGKRGALYPRNRGTTEEAPHLLYLFPGLLQRAFSISPLELSLFSTPLLEKKKSPATQPPLNIANTLNLYKPSSCVP